MSERCYECEFMVEEGCGMWCLEENKEIGDDVALEECEIFLDAKICSPHWCPLRIKPSSERNG